ncbi:MAG: hypothetical protein ACFFG0_27030 [Candidatus Thorarchaeota archaeon]
MRYIEYQIVLGDAPPDLLFEEIKEIAAHNQKIESEPAQEGVKKLELFPEGKIYHITEDPYIWTFSLIYRNKSFDVIKFKSAGSWREDTEEKQELSIDKALYVGVVAGVYFIMIDENIEENFNQLADMMDVFIDKTKAEGAPFIVYGLLENKQKIAELKTNKERLKNLADVKKWVVNNGGEFRLENIKEMRANLPYLITDYSHFILTKLKTKTNYPGLQLGEVHYLDREDLAALKEIEEALTEQLKAGETVDHLLSDLFFKFLQKPEFIEEKAIPIEIIEDKVEEFQVAKPPPSKIKIILEEIRKGLRRQCPKCFNMDRNSIREVIDHDNLIYDFGTDKIYGFKYICGQCSHEWRTEKDWKIEESLS